MATDYTFRVQGVLTLRDPDDFDAGRSTSDEAPQDALNEAGLRFTVEKSDLLGARHHMAPLEPASTSPA